MNQPSTDHCDQEQLQLLLNDQLAEGLQEKVVEHISQCDSCRRQLEALAGDCQWWMEVTACYQSHRSDDSSARVPGDSPAEPGDDRTFAIDFVVDYLEPCDEPQTLGRLGEYEILEVIGRGGMGVVLKGFHRVLARFVAVKMMAPHLAASGAARQRFIREARAAAAIVHPHVMPIHAVCPTARLPYLVMPFVACESLQQRIDRQGPLEIAEVLRVGLQAAQALAASHAQGLVHRDVKPANILLEQGVDRVLLTDFGLARAADDASLTRTGVIAGTPQYMSPEQSSGESVDARSDLFSLGSVLYAMCAGRPPFRAETTLAVLRRITDTQPRRLREINPAVPEWLERIVERLHEKAPDKRVSSSAEVAGLLGQCLAHVQQPLGNPLPRELTAENSDKRSKRAIAVGKWTAILGFVLMFPFLLAQFTDRNQQAADNSSNNSSSDEALDSTEKQPESPSTAELLESLAAINEETCVAPDVMTAVENQLDLLEAELHQGMRPKDGKPTVWKQFDTLNSRLDELQRNLFTEPSDPSLRKEKR
jgi:serine/threonine-protein kinase